MPSRWRLTFDLDREEHQAGHLHALLAHWLDEGLDAQSRGQHWSASPMYRSGTLLALDIGLIDDDRAERILDKLHESVGKPIRLGATRGTVARVDLDRSDSWGQLIDRARDARMVELDFVTPAGLRSGTRSAPFTPQQVVSGYRRIWRRYAPVEPHFDFAEVELAIAACELEPTRTRLHIHKQLIFEGVVGRVVLHACTKTLRDAAHPHPTAALAALCLIAPYSGTGSRRNWGMGVTETRVACAPR